MRVISGKARSTKLQAPSGLATRPTADFVKEALFSMLGMTVYNSNFMDLFAGTGAIGIEALSRGASHSIFVDNNNESIKCIDKNLTSTGLVDFATVIKSDVMQALSNIKNVTKNSEFDIIFMDPPYGNQNTKEILEKIVSENLLNDDGIIVIEQATNDVIVTHEKLEIYKEKNYKTAMFLFYSLVN